jgi:hypothetical protein
MLAPEALQKAVVAMTEARLALLEMHALLHPSPNAIRVASIIRRFDSIEGALRKLQKEVNK